MSFAEGLWATNGIKGFGRSAHTLSWRFLVEIDYGKWWISTKKTPHTEAEQTELKVYSIHSRLQSSRAYCQLQNENRIYRIFMFCFMAPHFKLKGAMFNQPNLRRFFCLEISMESQLVSSNHPNIKWHLGLQICLQTQSQPTELAKLTLDPFENTSCLPL